MANHVKISTIAAAAPAGMPESLDEAVDGMIAYWRGKFAKVLPDKPDLIVVPECCDRYETAFAPQETIAYYRARGNRVRDLFAQTAKANRCYITYSAVHEMPDGTWRNSVQLIDRSGDVVGQYNKNHLVIEENTQGGILCGREATVVETDFGKVGFAICFDLNFEPIRLRYKKLKPDLMVFSSVYHGGLMQAYWAYFLRCHMVTSIARLPSGILNPVGEMIATTTNYTDHVTATVNLDAEVCHLDYHQAKLAQLKKQYGSAATIHDPGLLGSVLVSSESKERTAKELLQEFQIERLDDYFARALAFHGEAANVEPDFKQAMLAGPDLSGVDLTRDRSGGRNVSL